MRKRKKPFAKEIVMMLVNGKVCYDMICTGASYVASAVAAGHAFLPKNVLMVTFLLLAGVLTVGWLVILDRVLRHKMPPAAKDILEVVGYQF